MSISRGGAGARLAGCGDSITTPTAPTATETSASDATDGSGTTGDAPSSVNDGDGELDGEPVEAAVVQFRDATKEGSAGDQVTIVLSQTGGPVPEGASVVVTLTGNAVARMADLQPSGATYTVPLSQGATTEFDAVLEESPKSGATSTLTLASDSVTIGDRSALTVTAEPPPVVVPRECPYERPGGVINAYTFPTGGGGFNYYLRAGSGCPSGAYGLGKEETAAWVSMSHVSWTGPPCGNMVLTACRKLVIQAQPHTGPLTRSVRVRITLGGATPFPWFTVTQHGVNHAPTVTLTCESPPCDEAEAGGMIEFQAEGTDPNGDTVTYAWTAMGVGNGGTLTPMTGAEVTWSAPDAVGDVTVTVTATESHADGETAEASQTISVIQATVCAVETGRADVTTGFPAAGELTDKLYFRRNPDRAPCSDLEVDLTDFKVAYKSGGPGWISAVALRESSDGGAVAYYTHYILFRLTENTTTARREADIYVDVGVIVRRVPIVQGGVDPPRPSCPTPTIPSTTSWVVGDRYMGAGFGRAWPKMGWGREGGGCTTTGLLLSQTGRFQVCGYETDPVACDDAVRAERATATTDPTAGDIYELDGDPAAQWVEFLVTEKTPDPDTDPTLAIGTSGDNDFGYRVYLHFGREHETDLSYGDSDYGTWGLSDPTWTFESEAAVTVDPELTESKRYPGIFTVACAATNGMPTDGFSVEAEVTYAGTTKDATADHTASEVHPTYPRICKP